MEYKLKIETYDAIISECKMYENLLAERKELLQAIFFGQGKYLNANAVFSEKDGRVIATQLSILNIKLSQLNKILFDMITTDQTTKMFEKSFEKSEGVPFENGSKNKFPGGTLSMIAPAPGEVFRPFGLQHIGFDCDEEGNPLTTKPE